MATKKTNKKTKQNTSKKTSSNRQKNVDRADAIRVTEIATVAVSVILFCLAIVSGNGVWNVLHNVYVGIFGMFAAIVLPLLTIVVTVIFSAKGDDAYGYTAKIVEAFVMVFILATFIHVVKNSTGDAFKETIINSYKSASFEFNGGFIGAVLGWLLLTLGKAPAIIISVVLFIVDLLLMTGLTIFQFVAGAAKPAKVTYEKVAPAIEERIERRRMNKENIDVPLDTQPPEEEVKKPKSRKKKAASSNEEMTKVPKEIIDEINRENSNIEMLKNATSRKEEKKPKSIDEIVKDASEDKPNEKKADKIKDFTVSKEAMESGINDYKLPSVELLSLPNKKSTADISGELKENAQRLIETLRSFNVNATITDISRGPTVTRYELKPAAGVRISKITNLADDIALNLAATHVRIEAPIPGKAAVGIEVPNTVKNTVSMRELIDTPEFYEQRSLLSAGIGKGNCVYCDIAKMPHLLVAGTTGSGKSVCMNSIITSILYRAKPDEVKFLMIDPKQVEFSKYANIPHLLVPVVTDPRKAAGALGWAVSEMLQRYQKLSQVGVRDIEGYNKYVQKHEDMESMPKICIFIDEFADLMMAAPKEVEDSVCRLAQMARAVGMHLVIATQRPSVDVITGLIKANISSRIALTVSSQIDSRTILDAAGAEKLLGHGDMLYNPIGASKPLRVQGCFISDEEVEALCDFVKNQGESQYDEEIAKEIEAKAVQDKKSSPFEDDGDAEQLDVLFDKAVDIVLETGTASTSFLQRKLSVGYARGAKIIDQLEEKGIIGPANGSKGREILINRQQWLEMQAYSSNKVPFTSENTEQMSFDEDEIEDDGVVSENYNDIDE